MQKQIKNTLQGTNWTELKIFDEIIAETLFNMEKETASQV